MSFQDDAGDFTMVSHSLAKEVGLVCAAVYGAVWRYCQMKEGICRASLNTIGNDINLDRATVLRSIEKLSKLGYLIDQTPDRRNAPHSYVIGRTVVIRNSLEETTGVKASETVAESNTVEAQTVAYNNSSIETVAGCNPAIAQNNATVAESYLNRVFKESPLKESTPKGVAAKPPLKPHSIPAVQVFVEVTGKYCLSKPQMKEVAEVIGDSPTALEKWHEVVKAWIMKGFKPTNAAGMLEWFKNGIPVYQQNGKDSTNGHNRQHDRPLQRTGEALEGEPTFDPGTRELVWPDGHRTPAVS